MASVARLLALPFLVLAHGVTGQSPTPDQGDRPRGVAAAEAWLATDQTGRDGLEAAAGGLIEGGPAALTWLGAQLTGAATAPNLPRSKGVRALASHVVLDFIRRQHEASKKTGLRHAGQYAPLLPLQPFAGELCLQLLLDTPDWYPDTHRIQLVPVLFDLYPRQVAGAAPRAAWPSPEQQRRVLEIVDDVAVEPEDLRGALAGLLWQWNVRQPAQRMLNDLIARSAEGEPEDRLFYLRALAELQYTLREYATAASTHGALWLLAKGNSLPLKPADHYAAACCYALSRNVDRGIEALQRCAAAQAQPNLDPSHRLERTLFDRDPELALLRADPRYAAIVQTAFATSEPPREGSGR